MNDTTVTPLRMPLPEGRRRVLYALRRRGEASAQDLARQLEMTLSGARQHLTALVDEGLVLTRDATPQSRRGRPTLLYRVSPAGDAYFPKAYGELTNELLGYLDDEEPDLIDRLFERRRDSRIANARARLARHRSFRAKVEELTRILDEDGYLATCEHRRDVSIIAEHNCAIWAVAQRYGQSCASEIEFIGAVLPDAHVERVQHMIAGEARCSYEIRPRRLRKPDGPR
ncbi:MAG TPA: ArsR family transcriptional regulator [Acidimicrobiales bacterium]